MNENQSINVLQKNIQEQLKLFSFIDIQGYSNEEDNSNLKKVRFLFVLIIFYRTLFIKSLKILNKLLIIFNKLTSKKLWKFKKIIKRIYI